MSATTSLASADSLQEANQRFYDGLWSDARLIEAPRFNTWPLVCSLVEGSHRRLEVAPGLRPHLPLAGTKFVDTSVPALAQLRQHGADATVGSVTALPLASRRFDLVCALDIVEHVDDDDRALAELCRVTVPGACMLLSVPLYAARWTAFDDLAGHRRRYEPEEIEAKLARFGLEITHSAVYGMQPRSSRLTDLGAWLLTHRRQKAMWWYNRVIMPLAVRFQAKLELRSGLIDMSAVDEVLLLCRKSNDGRISRGS